jgi:hypothetical protein
VQVFNDRAGSSDYTISHLSFIGSYNLTLTRDGEYHLAAGMMAAIAQQSFDYLNLTLGSQFIDGAFNPVNPSGEVFNETSQSYVDAGAGLLWYHYRNPRTSQFLGGSVVHVNQPDISFNQGQADNLYMKFSVNGGLIFKAMETMDIMPMAIGFVQGPFREADAGFLLKFLMERNKRSSYGGTAFYLGPLLRMVGDLEEILLLVFRMM